MATLERNFQSKLVKELRTMFPDAIVMKGDSSSIQGIGDILVLNGGRWASLECKRSEKAPHRPNQDYYVNKINETGGFARFIYPENKEEVLNDLQSAFKSGG